MRSLFNVTSLFVLLFLVGCAVKTERVGVDTKKASIANAELGVAYLSRGQYDVAMNKLKKAINFDDENTNAHHYIAELYRRLEQNNLASEHFKIAMDLNEEDSSIKNNYGIFLCGTGEYSKGLALFNEVLLDPLYSDKGKAYENMGLCTKKQGNIRITEKYFQTALKFNANLPAALLGLAQISFDKKNINAAESYFNRHNKISRHSAQSLWLGVLIERKKGRSGRSGSYVLKLKGNFPDSKEAKLLKKLNIR